MTAPTTPALGPIVVATVVVPDLDEASRWYTDWLGYEPWGDGRVDDGLAEAWSAPRAAGSPYRLLAPGCGRPGGVRLIEREVSLDSSPLLVAGWRSLEIVVADVLELRRQLEGSPFSIVGEPKPIDTNPSIVAMQATGPGREMLYLTQTSQDDTMFELPEATRQVDQMFIAVLSARDIKASQEFYASSFGAILNLDATPVPLEAVNRELGYPVDRPHPISALQLAGRSVIEIDEHPEELRREQPPRDDLPHGLAIVTFEHDDLDSIGHQLPAQPHLRAEAPYLGRPTALLRGADGERLELIARRRPE
jgi:catechol 2,3-dioxygenase-like lactoylglutathione lyase family enzyme